MTVLIHTKENVEYIFDVTDVRMVGNDIVIIEETSKNYFRHRVIPVNNSVEIIKQVYNRPTWELKSNV